MKRIPLFFCIALVISFLQNTTFGFSSKRYSKQSFLQHQVSKKDSFYTISGSFYRDLDFDFETNDDWVEVKDWKFYLLDTMNNLLDSTVTDSLGDFEFTDLRSGWFRVREETRLNWVPLGIDLGLPASTISQVDSLTIQIYLDSLRHYSFATDFVQNKALDLNPFTGADDDNFENPNNWLNGKVPSKTDSVVIPFGFNVVIYEFSPTKAVDSTINIGGLSVLGSLSIQGNRIIKIGIGDFSISGTVTIQDSKKPNITLGSDFLISGNGNKTSGSFSPGNSTVTFQSGRIQHTSKASFYRLIVGESKGLVSDGNLTILDSMAVEDSLDAQSDSVIISNNSPNALKFSDDDATIRRGTVIRSISAGGGDYLFQNNGTEINFPNSKSETIPQTINVTTHPNTYSPGMSQEGTVNHYYDIAAIGGSQFNATLQLKYDEEELPDGLDPSDVRLMKSEDGINFVNVGGVADPLNFTVTLANVSSFSRWQFGQVGHKAGDTTAFASFTQESLALGAVKMKKKKGKLTPVPNAGNVRDATFKSKFPKPGMVLGVLLSDKNVLKTHAYVTIGKGKTLLKLLPQSGSPQSFSEDQYKGKPFIGIKKDPKLSAYNNGDGNGLLAELIALKTNIAASDAGFTPPYAQSGYPPFGEIVFDEEQNPCSGFSLRDIAKMADTILTFNQLTRSNSSDFDANVLYDCISRVNAGFSGKVALVDTTVFDPLKIKPIKPINQVPFLKRPSKFVVHIPENVLGKPEQYSLEQNYPNPFNPTTAIRFSLLAVSNVTLKVYNVLGQEVATLLNNAEMESGIHEIQFDASRLSSGVYFYRMSVTENGTMKHTEIKKMVLMK